MCACVCVCVCVCVRACRCGGVCTLHCTYSAMHAQVLRELGCKSMDTTCLVLGFILRFLSL